MALAARLDIYAYDAYFIACALKLDVPLLTLDGGLSRSANLAGVHVMEVADADLS